MFKRDLVTADPNDNPIGDNCKIIFAFNPTENTLVYHGPTRSSSFTVNFIRDYQGPAVQVQQQLWIRVILYIWAAISILFSLFIMVLVVVKREYFVFQTPEFCLIVCAGTIFSYISVILLLPDNLTDGMCWAHLWLFGLGFWMVFAGIFLKNFRVFVVFTAAEKMSIRIIKWKDLIPPLLICFVIEGIFQACWDGIDTVRPNLDRYDDFNTKTFVIYCGGNKWMWLGSVLVRILVLLGSCVLAYFSRALKKEQNYSKETGLVLYTSAIVLIVAIPLGFALNTNPIITVLLKGIAICLAYNAVCVITFWDAMIRIFTGKDARVLESSSVSAISSNSQNNTTVMSMNSSK